MSRIWYINKWNPDTMESCISGKHLSKSNCQLDIENQLLSDISRNDGISRMSEACYKSLSELEAVKDSLESSRHYIVSDWNQGWNMSLYKIQIEYAIEETTVLKQITDTEEYQEEQVIMIEKPVVYNSWFGQKTRMESVPEIQYETKHRQVQREQPETIQVVKKTSVIQHVYKLSTVSDVNPAAENTDTRNCRDAVEFFVSRLNCSKLLEAVSLNLSVSRMIHDYPELFNNPTYELFKPAPLQPIPIQPVPKHTTQAALIQTAPIQPAPKHTTQAVPKQVKLSGLGMLNDDIMARHAEMFGKPDRKKTAPVKHADHDVFESTKKQSTDLLDLPSKDDQDNTNPFLRHLDLQKINTIIES